MCEQWLLTPLLFPRAPYSNSPFTVTPGLLRSCVKPKSPGWVPHPPTPTAWPPRSGPCSPSSQSARERLGAQAILHPQRHGVSKISHLGKCSLKFYFGLLGFILLFLRTSVISLVWGGWGGNDNNTREFSNDTVVGFLFLNILLRLLGLVWLAGSHMVSNRRSQDLTPCLSDSRVLY